MSKNRFIIIAVFLFLAALFYLPVAAPLKFNTPDETANFFFAKIFAETGHLKITEPLNQIADNAIHPRGVNIIGGYLVPESFLGLPLIYGVLGRVFGTSSLPFLAPFLILSILPFCYLLIKKFFGQKIAALSLLLLIINPVFLYNAGRGFYHNNLFLIFLILFLFFSLYLTGEEKNEKKSWLFFSAAGIFLGGALFVRPAEVLWVGCLAGLLLFYNIFKKNWAAFGLLFSLLPVGLMLYFNHNLYGGYFRFGYAATEAIIDSTAAAVPQLSKLNLVSQLIFPFGLHPLAVARRFVSYGIAPLWWYAAMIFLGAASLAPRLWQNQRLFVYFIILFLFSLYLVLFYGGFTAEFFTDPGQEVQYGIGSAYLRYWLPLYVLAAPLAACGLLFLKKYLLKYRLVAVFVIISVFLSIRSVFWLKPEGFLPIGQNLNSFSQAARLAETKTPANSVFFLPKWADRIYFPEREVAVDLEGKNVVKIIKGLLGVKESVFYLSGRGAIPLNASDLQADRLTLKRRFDLEEKGKMYQIIEE